MFSVVAPCFGPELHVNLDARVALVYGGGLWNAVDSEVEFLARGGVVLARGLGGRSAWNLFRPLSQQTTSTEVITETEWYLHRKVPVFYGLMLLYLAHALFVAVRGKGHLGIVGLLVLFGDTVYFLILASYGTERLIWLAALFFLFLLSEALLFYSPAEVSLIVSVCAVFCTVLPYDAVRLELTVIVARRLGAARHQPRATKASVAQVDKSAASERAWPN